MSRPTWNQYFLNLAAQAATRATCDRAHVGCVLVGNKQIIATGYNGAVAGSPSCDDAGHYIEDNHCVRVNHAEVNAIAQAARYGHATDGAVAYITHRPCLPCARALCAAGITEVIYEKEYGSAPDFLPLRKENIYARGTASYVSLIDIHPILDPRLPPNLH